MIVYKIYKFKNFEEIHQDFFNKLLEALKQQNYLSPNIDEIIFTDDLAGEIERFSANQNEQNKLTRTREYFAIGKTINHEGKKKIFFDALYVNVFFENSPQIFIEHLLEVYAEDIVSINYKVPDKFNSYTPLAEVVEIFFTQWATKVVTNDLVKLLAIPHKNIRSDVKIFVDAFKRNIRKSHYNNQADIAIGRFWIESITEVDYFIRKCLDVKFDNGSFTNLQEFSEIIPQLLSEIEIQTQNLLKKENIIFTNMKQHVLEILNKCSIELLDENRMNVHIIETPKKIFKNNLVDTEPRIVAFIDILGFSAIIEEYDSNIYSNILNELHDTLEMAIKTSIENKTDLKDKTDLKENLEYRMFSDCICLSLPYIEFENDFHIQFLSLANIVNVYQLFMMQKGFFVRGGISMGSFYADKNMIFSGGLVNAYKLEQSAIYPVIAIDQTVLERLKKNYLENTKDLFYENIILYSDSKPEIKFLDPFDVLDKSIMYLDHIQSTFDDLIKTNEKDKDDPISGMTSSFLKLTNTLTRPIYEFAKSQMKPQNINLVKEKILEEVNNQLNKYNEILSQKNPDCQEYKEAEKIIIKHEHLKTLTEWSIGKTDSSLFKYYKFT